MKETQTKVVRTHDINVDKEYYSWINEIKTRYRSAQIKAAIRVNSEQLRFNWLLGRDLVMRKAEEKWGSGIVEQVSLDLQAAFPKAKGFSTSNIWRMKQWYLFYSSDIEKLAQVVRELQHPDTQGDTILQQVIAELPELFSLVPWGHHIDIVTKCSAIDEALFYIKRTIAENWSRSTLVQCIKADLYHTSGGAVTNFSESLTARFLLELGTGFAYLGRQKQIIVGGKTRKLDMLFFHIKLNCYVVIELKAVPFQPEFTGKLNYYVNIVDDLIKTPDQNPTIGLLICSDKDSTDVRYAIKGVQTPLGVSSYNNVHLKEIQDQLPSVEELKELLQQ